MEKILCFLNGYVEVLIRGIPEQFWIWTAQKSFLEKEICFFILRDIRSLPDCRAHFVSDEEVSSIVDFLADKNPAAQYNPQIEQQVNTASLSGGGSGARGKGCIFLRKPASLLLIRKKLPLECFQRMFKIGFNRAARIMDQLCDAGVVGPEEGTKPRKVLMSMEEFQNFIEESL